MIKPTRPQYSIKTCPSSDFEELENLLNTMADDGWELYSMHEVDVDDAFQYNCIFVRDSASDEYEDESLDFIGFKSKMERIMNPVQEPIDVCIDIQKKIKDKRDKIAQIKSLIDSTEENRSDLNDEMSVTLKELDSLKQKLMEIISPEVMQGIIGENKLSISLSEELLDLVSPDSPINLITQIVEVRQKLTESLGYIIPKVDLKCADSIQANEFVINVRGIPALKANAYPGYIMYIRDELALTKLPKNAIKDIDYITGKQIVWIEESTTKNFWAKGLNATQFIGRLLDFVSIKHIEDIFDYSDVNRYIEIVGALNLFLIENIIPDFLSISEIKYILSNLLKEKVSIKDIVFIFEKINDFADDASKEDLLGRIRMALSRQISKSVANKNSVIEAYALDDKTISYISQKDKNDEVVRIDASKIRKVASKIQAFEKSLQINDRDVILIAPIQIRHITFLVFSQFIPNIRVVAKEELSIDYQLDILEQV